MPYVTLIAALLLCAACTTQPTHECEPSDGHSFICGAQRPEDLARIPDTRWLVFSGFTNGAGQFEFTSALPVRLLELLLPALSPVIDNPPNPSPKLASR